MPKRLISSGSAFEAVAGYSRAVVAGDWIHLVDARMKIEIEVTARKGA